MAVQLNVEFATMKRIAGQHSEIDIRVLEAMDCWLKTDKTASWKKIAKAVKAINKPVLAQHIEDKYIKKHPTPRSPPLSQTVQSPPTNTHTTAGELLAKYSIIQVALS